MSLTWIIARLVWLVVAGLAAVVVAYRRHTSSNVVLALALDATPYLTALNVCCVGIGVLFSDWPLALISAALAAYQLTALGPHGDQPASVDDRPELALVCSNVYTRNRKPDALAARLLRSDPDVIVITEWNPAFQAAFQRAGGDRYAHRVVDPSDTGDYAVCILSRLTLEPESRMVAIGPLLAAQAVVRHDGTDIRILGVNPRAIVDRGGYRTWRAQMQALRSHISTLVGPSVVIGDFNTTRHRPEFQDLLHAGFTDALEPAGTHRTPSFKLAANGPLGRTRPLVRLDHALISEGLTATDSRNLRGDGTDHLPFTLNIHVQSRRVDAASQRLAAVA